LNFICRIGTLSLLFFSVISMQAQQPAAETPPKPAQTTPKSADQDLPSFRLRSTVEDFSTITLDKSKLEPLPPVLGSNAKRERSPGERWQVKWRDVDPFDLYGVKPGGVERPPVIVYLYGYPATAGAFNNDGWCERVTQGGYAAVGFVAALTG